MKNFDTEDKSLYIYTCIFLIWVKKTYDCRFQVSLHMYVDKIYYICIYVEQFLLSSCLNLFPISLRSHHVILIILNS